jgi:hypothetical protein
MPGEEAQESAFAGAIGAGDDRETGMQLNVDRLKLSPTIDR